MEAGAARPHRPRSGSLSIGARISRAGRTGAALAKVYLGYKGVRLLEGRSPDAISDALRRWWLEGSARTLADTSLELGGLMVKACQFLSARADLLPPALLQSLARLQDRVPAHSYTVVRAVLTRELGRPPEEIFAHVFQRPIASASLAQVHRATLRDGRDVAVKVQRPEVEAAIRADLDNLRLALGTVERVEGPVGLSPLLDELERLVPLELDFEAEARNATRLCRVLCDAPGLHVPSPVEGLITPRVIVTEYVSGIKITDRRRLIRAGVEPSAIASALVDAYGRQIFGHGFFHADPHPGNLIVTGHDGGARLAFVDFGLAAELSAGFRRGLASLVTALVARDAAAVCAALEAVGLEASGRDRLDEISRRVLSLVAARRRKERTVDVGGALLDAIGSDPRTRIPPDLWLVARVLGLVWGIAGALAPDADPLRDLAPHLMASAEPA